MNAARSALDFEEAFERHHPALFRYLLRITGDPDVAADVAQEAFVRLLDHTVDEGKVRSWLFTVATNLVRDRARTRKRRRRLLEGEDLSPERPDRPDEAVERREDIDSVRAALDGLSRRDRKLLMLREEGFRYAEIAEIIGVAPNSVGKLLSRALHRFEERYSARPEAGADEREQEVRRSDDAASE